MLPGRLFILKGKFFVPLKSHWYHWSWYQLGLVFFHPGIKKIALRKTWCKTIFSFNILSYSLQMLLFLSFSMKELISLMLHVNAEARYTAAQILSHPWVSVSKSHFTCL